MKNLFQYLRDTLYHYGTQLDPRHRGSYQIQSKSDFVIMSLSRKALLEEVL